MKSRAKSQGSASKPGATGDRIRQGTPVVAASKKAPLPGTSALKRAARSGKKGR